MDQKRFGRRIKAFRKLKGYTQVEFAKKLCVPLSVIGSIERGVKPISDDLLDIVVHTLDISKEELMLYDEDNTG
ncbi:MULTISPECIES: helix-turn-helix domain-containing protein [Virgibacillus]|uniref:Helix-turn-helix protein n=1 Tax=Virgibacillus dokdonensis TaxID=302167 RepID=A0A2K9IYB3_9BACI|nr:MULTISPECIES: helix-turn-helix transcriptional regulator [Virgibacillus]AUJ24434.1 helix-turn-helix protein [Virgibacillus dokdonensis]NWO12886.1 helix-turn-helix transcriptional regulator [Virgibacillus sp.]